MSILFAPLTSSLYHRSWRWLMLALIRGSLFTLFLLIPLWVGASQTPGVSPWLYALRVGIPLGFLTTFPTVSIEVWAVQRRMKWFVVLLTAYLSVLGGWSVGLLLGNSIHQAASQGTTAVSAWLRHQFTDLLITPSLWLRIVVPPLSFAVATTMRITKKRHGIWILCGLCAFSLLGLLLLRGKPPHPLIFLILLQAPLAGGVLSLYYASEQILRSLAQKFPNQD